MNTQFTRHARTRLQQRSIPLAVVDLLQDFGCECYCGRGAIRYIFDRNARASLQRQLGHDQLQEIEPWLNVYAVVGDAGQIVTVAHARRRFHRV